MQLVTAIAAGDVHSLAIQNGDVYAWGMGDFGALGNGVDEEVNYSNVPLKVLDLDIDLVSVSAGNFTSYALSADGSLWVWGRNDNGQLGLGHNTDQVAPVQRIPPAGYRFTGIEVGGFHAVALIASTAINASAAVETGINQQIAPGGGTTVTGGTQVTFANILTPGDFTLEYAATTFDELDLPSLPAGGFVLSGEDHLQMWQLDFDGEFSGAAELILRFDPFLLPQGFTADDIQLHHLRSDTNEWEVFSLAHGNLTVDMTHSTLTLQVDGFSPFILTAVPEPASLSWFSIAGVALLRRRREK